jgi:tetratricopeptide (TPR) repeat protein
MRHISKTGRWQHFAWAVLLAAAAAGPVVHPSPARAAGGADLPAAEAALSAGDYDRAVSILEAAPAGSARHHYLLGMALFERTRREVLAEREKGGLAPDRLNPPQAKGYQGALGHFEQVVALDPQGADAPEASFQAALLHDYGYLQRLTVTLDKYREVMRLYPGTDAAEKARLRVEGREELFKMH